MRLSNGHCIEASAPTSQRRLLACPSMFEALAQRRNSCGRDGPSPKTDRENGERIEGNSYQFRGKRVVHAPGQYVSHALWHAAAWIKSWRSVVPISFVGSSCASCTYTRSVLLAHLFCYHSLDSSAVQLLSQAGSAFCSSCAFSSLLVCFSPRDTTKRGDALRISARALVSKVHS